jgi:hypothetical protein
LQPMHGAHGFRGLAQQLVCFVQRPMQPELQGSCPSRGSRTSWTSITMGRYSSNSVTPGGQTSSVRKWRTHELNNRNQSPLTVTTGAIMNANNQPVLVINCDSCVMRETDACSDCLVTFMCGDTQESAVVFNLEEQRAVRLLANAGMVPTLRHRAVS